MKLRPGIVLRVSTLVLVLFAACEERKGTPVATTATTASSAPTSLASSLVALPTSVASAAPSTPSGSGDDAGTSDLAGVWEGSYEAKKATIGLPPKVKGDALGTDDGKTAIGAGTVELAISGSGDVTGKVAGALGAGEISGKVDGGMLRASLRPDDPRAPKAMTGVLIGLPKGELIACDLHVAGPDGTTIREATVVLKRKK